MDERAELAPALSELAAALHALIPVLLDNGQAPSPHSKSWILPPKSCRAASTRPR